MAQLQFDLEGFSSVKHALSESVWFRKPPLEANRRFR
jgi:hypothetical protein